MALALQRIWWPSLPSFVENQMKYVFAVLILISSLAKADACQDIGAEFLSLLAQNKKDDVLKLVRPQARLYTEIKEDRNHTYSILLQNRFAQFQLLYSNAFAIMPDTNYSVPGSCHLQIFGLEGPERHLIGFARVKEQEKKLLIEEFALGSDL